MFWSGLPGVKIIEANLYMTFQFANAVKAITVVGAGVSRGIALCLLLGLTACSGVGPANQQRAGADAPPAPAPAPQMAAAQSPTVGQSEAQPESRAATGWDVKAYLGKEWRLVTLYGAPANQVPSPRLQWVSAEQVVGSGGCNRFSGRAVLTAGEARFGPLASTRMACVPEPSSQEDRFFKALEVTVKVRLEGTGLQLLDQAGVVVAQLAED